MYMSVCKPAEQNGAFILHGCRRVMHNDKQPAFRAVYNAFSAVSRWFYCSVLKVLIFVFKCGRFWGVLMLRVYGLF